MIVDEHTIISMTPAAAGTRIRVSYPPAEVDGTGGHLFADVIAWALVARRYDPKAEGPIRRIEPVFIDPGTKEPVYWSEYSDKWDGKLTYVVDRVPEASCGCG